MKRFTLILALVLMVAMHSYAERVTSETAQKAATTFLNNNGAKSAQLTDLSTEAGFPNLYIFNCNPGFVVMAADDCVQPILGYSLTETFETKGMPENLIWWLQGYNDQIQDMIDNNRSNDAAVATEWRNLKNGSNSKSVSKTIVEPLLTTTWDQNYPYNYSCPSDSDGPGGHVYAGCVATAMAQVMKYWNYPTMGNGSHSYTSGSYGEQTANFGETTYDWDNMTNSISNSSDQANIDAIATLIYHCGVAVDMNYGKGSSGASSSKVPAALIDYFNYAPSAAYISRDGFEDDQWIAFLQSELLEGRPLFYSGSYPYQSNGQTKYGGHAFVCDGYRSDNYFHFNWGWSGSDGHGINKGYWLIGDLHPGTGGSGSGSGTYNLSNAVAAWVEPISNLTAPTLTASVSDNNVTLTWNSVENATSYDLYKDNAKIATDLTDLSYVDNNIGLGHYPEYYLRAKNPTNKSNPSNRVIATGTYHNLIPQNPTATIAISDNSVNLSWTEPQSQSMNMHYGIGQSNSYYGSGLEDGTYWGQCYPSDYISAFGGMVIDHVSIYLGFPGNYSLFLYQDNVTLESNLLASKDFTGTIGWNDIILDNNIPLDLTKDLWVVFHTSNTIRYPAYYGEYNGANKEHAHYLWHSFSNNIPYTLSSDDISWPIKIHLTDGNFTYNIYRNNILIAEHQTNSTYQDVDLSDGTIEYHITTYANNWESDASDVVSITYTTEHRISDAITISEDLILSNQNRYIIESTGFLTVLGTLSNSDPANLNLKDGAQLIHNSSGVKATVHKNISTNGETPCWNFIASPMTTLTVDNTAHTNIASNEFDLYRFNQSPYPTTTNGKVEYLEWENWKQVGEHHHFNLESGRGYLYAHNPGIDAVFIGELANPQNGEVQVSYSTANPDPNMRDWNLIGNPFACNAYINRSYYKISNDSKGIQVVEDNAAISPCTGIMIKTENTNGETVTFTKEPQSSGAKGSLNIALAKSDTRDNAIMDNAIVTFNQKNELGKFFFGQNDANIYFPKNDEEYAIAYSQSMGEMPLNFIAYQDGYYCLNISSEDVNFNYLHLIDNITGTDVDLLQTPSYSFNARTTDYKSRFKLVFVANNEDSVSTGSTAFAFFSNGSWIICNTGQATLQVIDMAGRILNNEHIEGNYNISFNFAPGLYLLRLINGNNLQMQKIIIE